MPASESPLYRLLSLQRLSDEAVALLDFDPGHPIYAGHFPGHPITPGVCLLQAVRTVVEALAGCPCDVVRAGQIRYFRVHEPGIGTRIRISIKSGMYAHASPRPCLASPEPFSVKAELFIEEPNALKLCVMNLTFQCLTNGCTSAVDTLTENSVNQPIN